MQIETIASKIKTHPLPLLLTLALSVRLYNLNSPIIGAHSWRQADTAAIARNFYNNGFNFLYPQVDWGGIPGYCETEFPIYSFIVALLYKIFGQSESLGRLFSVACFLGATYFLYRLAADYFNERVALWSCFVCVLLPLNVYYSRTFQPESMLLMCCVGCIYYFSNWLRSEKYRDLILSGMFGILACEIKVLPIIYLGLPIFYLTWTKFGIKLFFRLVLWVYAIVTIGCVFSWYYHAHGLFLQYGNTFGFSADSTNRYDYSILLKSWFWTELIFRTILRHFTIFCFPLFVAGLLIARKNQQEYVFDVWAISVALTWILVPTTSVVHEYYQLPFMLPAVIFIGKACDRYWFRQRRSIVACLGLALVTGSLIYAIDYMSLERVDNSEVLKLATEIKQHIPKQALIISSTGGDPTLLYLSERQGWLINHQDVTPNNIASKQKLGAEYLVGSFKFVESYNRNVTELQQQKINLILDRDRYNLSPDRQNFIIRLKSN